MGAFILFVPKILNFLNLLQSLRFHIGTNQNTIMLEIKIMQIIDITQNRVVQDLIFSIFQKVSQNKT